jgi:hypothetical protein
MKTRCCGVLKICVCFLVDFTSDIVFLCDFPIFSLFLDLQSMI